MKENEQVVKIYQFASESKGAEVEDDVNKYISNGYKVIKLEQSSNKYEHVITVVFEKTN